MLKSPEQNRAIITIAPKSSIIAKAVKNTFNDKGTLFPSKDKNGEQIFDVVDHYSYDEALKVIYLDDNWTDGVSEIVWINIYPLTKSQMRERKKQQKE